MSGTLAALSPSSTVRFFGRSERRSSSPLFAGYPNPPHGSPDCGMCADSSKADLVSRHTGTHGRTVNALLATDLESYLPNDLLVKMDIAAMANSVEGRSPFLDHKVVEYCARLPVRYKIRAATRKYLLRKIASDLVPRPNIRRRKMGFGIPVGEWMRTEHKRFLEDVLLGSHARRRRLFQP